jgi:hypothetical protein
MTLIYIDLVQEQEENCCVCRQKREYLADK